MLLIGSGWRPYREYLLRGFARHLPLWLIDERPASWQLPYLVGSSVVGLLDEQRVVADRAGLIAAALQVAQDRKVAGVLTYEELLVTATAHVAERLGVRGLSVRGAENCRDKSRSRAELSRAGIAQPRYALVHDLAGGRRGGRPDRLPGGRQTTRNGGPASGWPGPTARPSSAPPSRWPNGPGVPARRSTRTGC